MNKRASFRINGMDCAEEVALLRRELSHVAGITDLTFDVVRAKMTVEYQAPAGEEGIQEAVARTGMRAEAWSDARKESWWDRNGRAALAWLSGLALVAALLDAAMETGDFVGSFLAHQHHAGEVEWHRVGLFGMAVMAGLWTSLPKALASLRAGRADMNVLMVISIAGAIVLNEWPEAATVAFLFSMANLLESWSMGRARKAVQALLDLSPKEAAVVHGDHTHRVAVEALRVGQMIAVTPGERIPTDGVIAQGRSTVDQALLTGESVPVRKEEGDEVYAGTMNVDGALVVRVRRPHSDTTLARIQRMVEDSQRRRTASEQWVERFAAVYTPVMIGLAVAVAVFPPVLGFGAWGEWFYRSMVILLTSCPCALVISTPVTMVSALTSAARRGVLVKGGIFLEVAARVKAVAFDKTGVLTSGEPEVKEFVALNGDTAAALVAQAAGMASRSEHPLARAVVRHAERQGLVPVAMEVVEALPGRGTVAGDYWMGSSRLAAERTGAARQELESIEERGLTLVAYGRDREVLALAGIEDPVRPEAAGVLERLKHLGIQRVEMLTGDHEQAARKAAAELRLDGVEFHLLPEEKEARVAALERDFGPAAMVGDGINDTQAIARASLGVALGKRATDVALETADAVLMGNDLRQLTFLFRHAKRALAVVQQNVVLAISLKAIFLVMAALGQATLWMAVAADMGATFLVTLNALRLLRAEKIS